MGQLCCSIQDWADCGQHCRQASSHRAQPSGSVVVYGVLHVRFFSNCVFLWNMKSSINCFFPLVLLFLEPLLFFGNCEIADQTDLGEGKVNLFGFYRIIMERQHTKTHTSGRPLHTTTNHYNLGIHQAAKRYVSKRSSIPVTPPT